MATCSPAAIAWNRKLHSQEGTSCLYIRVGDKARGDDLWDDMNE